MSSPMTVAGYVVDELAAWDVSHVFGVPGDALIPLLESLRGHPRLRFVSTRHEGAAALMASAYAKLTGRAAACASDAGPGAVQLLNGVYDAAMDRVPMLVLTGGLPTHKTATHWPQDANLDLVYQDATVFNHTLRSAAQVSQILTAALRQAHTRPGPARVGLPVDLQREELAGAQVAGKPDYLSGLPAPDERDVEAAVHLLRTADRPVVLAGRGARTARQGLLKLAERLEAPILSTLPGVGVVPADHPHYAGVVGEAGTQAAADVLGSADVALVVGSTWWQPAFVPEGLQVIQVDLHRSHLGMTFPVSVALPGPAEEVIGVLQERVPARERSGWRAFWERGRAGWHDELRRADELAGSHGEGVHPATLMTILAGVVDREAILCVDTGQHTYWFGRYFFPDRHTVLVSGHWRTVGFALPAAIGAALAAPRQPVVALTGDGGLGMTLGELTTVVRERLPIVVVVCRDGRYAEEEDQQARAGVQPFGTRFLNPDFAAVAEAAGCWGIRVERPRDLRRALERALRVEGPALVDVRLRQVSYALPQPARARDPRLAGADRLAGDAGAPESHEEPRRQGIQRLLKRV